jgi:hypothetical protein
MREPTIRQRIISDVVPWRVEENEEDDSNSSGLVWNIAFQGEFSSLHSDCPADVYDEHADRTSEKHGSSLEPRGNQSNGSAVDEAPCGVSKIDHRFRPSVCVSDHH